MGYKPYALRVAPNLGGAIIRGGAILPIGGETTSHDSTESAPSGHRANFWSKPRGRR